MGLLDALRRLLGAAEPAPVDDLPLPTHVPSPDQPRRLILYTGGACPYCVRVKAAMERLGLEIEERDVLFREGAQAELIEGTGGAQVPALFIDGQPLLESALIIRWLQAYAQGGGAA